MFTLSRRRRYAWYNVLTQEYLDLRLGLPVAAPLHGHQSGEIGYLEEGGIHVIPRQLTPHSEDKLSPTTTPLVAEDVPSTSKLVCCEELTSCGGIECGDRALDEDDTLTLCGSDLAGDSSVSTDVRHGVDFVQLQMEDGITINGFVVFPSDLSHVSEPTKKVVASEAQLCQDAEDGGSFRESGSQSDDTQTLCSPETIGPSQSNLQLGVKDVRRLFKEAPRWNAWANSVEGDGLGMDVQLNDMVVVRGVQSAWVRNHHVTQEQLEAALTAYATSNNIPLDPKSPDASHHLDMRTFADRTGLVHEQTFVHFYKIHKRRWLHTYVWDAVVRAWDRWIWEEARPEKYFEPVKELLRYILQRLPFARMAIASSKDFFAVFENRATVPSTPWETRLALWRRMPPVRFIKGTRVAALDLTCREIEGDVY